MGRHDLAVFDDAADDLVGVLFEFQLFVSFLDEVSLYKANGYNLEDVHGLEDAIAAQDHEIIGFYLNVIADHIRDATEI